MSCAPGHATRSDAKVYQDRLRTDFGTALEMALIDPLTGLYNQRYLMRHLHGLLESGQNRELAVLMIDVDHFKSVNDEYGHVTGDKVLRAVADVLRGNTRVFDSLARYGGEEFVVVMPGTGVDDASLAAERLRSAVEGASVYMGFRKPLSADYQHRRRLQGAGSRYAGSAAACRRRRALRGQAGGAQSDRDRRRSALGLAQPT